MSFEGSLQCICPDGHYFDTPAYMSSQCDTCGKKAAWVNVVDDTNCDSVGEIPMAVLEEHFGLGNGLFRVPTYEESDPLQHYRPADGEKDENGVSKLIPINTPKPPKRGRRRKYR